MSAPFMHGSAALYSIFCPTFSLFVVSCHRRWCYNEHHCRFILACISDCLSWQAFLKTLEVWDWVSLLLKQKSWQLPWLCPLPVALLSGEIPSYLASVWRLAWCGPFQCTQNCLHSTPLSSLRFHLCKLPVALTCFVLFHTSLPLLSVSKAPGTQVSPSQFCHSPVPPVPLFC